MPILNRNYFCVYPTNLKPVHLLPTLRSNESFDLSKKQYWYIAVFNCNSFDKKLWERVIPVDVLGLLKTGEITLIVNNFAESFTNILDPLYRLLICDFNISEDNVILFTGARDIISHLEGVADSYNKKQIKIVLTSEFECYIQKKENNNLSVNKTYIYNKKFINLTRRWRFHKVAFVSLLVLHDLLQHGYVSLIEDDDMNNKWDIVWDGILDKHEYFRDLLESNKAMITNSTPLIVDRSDPNINPDWADLESNKLYQDSYFSIVSETNFYSPDSRFLTEKTFKTIIHRHPFLLLSLPGSLEFFREKGYKTFSPLINEEYDKELDPDIRMRMILDETIRLCNLSESELKTFVDGTKEICDYNYNVLASKTIFNTPLN